MIRGADIYELRLFDQPLARFSFGEDEPAVLHEYDHALENLLPAGMKPTNEGLWRWLSTRALPQNRRFATELCRSLGLSVNDRSGILSVSRGLSLNDSYWIVPEGCSDSFEECNLYENGFSSVLAAVAYTGIVSDQRGLTPATPELTTNGNLRKAWRIEADGTRRLYKGSTDLHAEYGEARAEFLASQVAQAMGLYAVRYGLAQWDETPQDAQDARDIQVARDARSLRNIRDTPNMRAMRSARIALDAQDVCETRGARGGQDVCSTCDCFCSPEVSYVPQALAFDQRSHAGAARSYLLWDLDEFEKYASMMVFDSLVYNTDRHLTNFGVLRASRTGEYLGCAPVFDNGRSLFFNLAFDQADSFETEANFALPSWPQVTFDEQAQRLMGETQIEQLNRLASFEFANSEKHPFPEAFLASLSAFVRRRAEELASYTPVSRDVLLEAVKRMKLTKQN